MADLLVEAITDARIKAAQAAACFRAAAIYARHAAALAGLSDPELAARLRASADENDTKAERAEAAVQELHL